MTLLESAIRYEYQIEAAKKEIREDEKELNK